MQIYKNDLKPFVGLLMTYMTLLGSDTGAFIWRGTIPSIPGAWGCHETPQRRTGHTGRTGS